LKSCIWIASRDARGNILNLPRHGNAHLMLRAAKLEAAAHAKAMTIVAAAVRPFNNFT
jgi:hypothetical protein